MKKFLSILVGLTIIALIYFFSCYLFKFLNIKFPAPIFGIFILFFLLKTGIIKEELIKEACDFLLKYMILFFIPLFVGTINYYEIIKDNLLAILLTVFITTFIVIITVGAFYEFGMKITRLYKIRKVKKQ